MAVVLTWVVSFCREYKAKARHFSMKHHKSLTQRNLNADIRLPPSRGYLPLLQLFILTYSEGCKLFKTHDLPSLNHISRCRSVCGNIHPLIDTFQ